MNQLLEKNAIIYCRVSSTKQAQQGDSIEDQERICRGIAERENMKVLQVFKEQFSGRKDERPVVDEIFSFIKNNPIVNFLIVRAIDRFSRGGTLGYESLKEKLTQYGVTLIDSNRIIQPSKNTLEHLGVEYEWSRIRPSEITELVIAQQGKSEVSQILTRMIGAEINLVREGYKVRRADDGYLNKKIYVEGKKRVIQVPDPERAHFFIKIFEMSITHTDQQILDHINSMGYKSKDMKIWSKAKDRIIGIREGKKLSIKQLQRIRQRPIYAGVNNEKWLTEPIKAEYPGLVSIDQFNESNKGKIYIEEIEGGKVVRIHKDYNPQQLKRTKDNPLFPHKSVTLCHICKKPFLGSSPKGKCKPVPTYHCARKHKYFGVNKNQFEKSLTNLAFNLEYKDKAFAKAFEAVLMNKFREKEKELGEFSVQVGKTVTELEMEKKNLIESYTSTKNEIIREELEKKINQIHKEIGDTREQKNGIEVQENDIYAFVRYVKYLMEHPVEMLVKQKDLNALRGLFSVVFDELPTYEEIVNGTPKLSLPYRLSEEFKVNKDLCVSLIEMRPNDTLPCKAHFNSF